jgi:SagB-type dehydrogenase family enzyme
LARRVSTITRDPELIVMMSRSWKTYAGFPKIKLPEGELGDVRLQDALMRRRSQLSSFSGESISAEQLSAVLRNTYGPTLTTDFPNRPHDFMRFRASPSAGGLYPLEIYPLVFNVEGCEPGLYHYCVVDHSLELLRSGPIRDEFLGRNLTPYRELAATCSVLFAITAVLPRTVSKYLFRGYRFLSYDVGAVLQSFYLTGTALGLGTCAIGGFFDNEVGEFIQVDNVDEHVMMLFSIGQSTPDPRRPVNG